MKRLLRLPRQFSIRPSGEVALRGIEQADLGVPAYLVRGGNEPVFRLEFLFRAGKLYEQQRHAASATANMLSEGTLKMSAQELAEAFEYYGATVRCYASPDTISFAVHGLSKFAGPVLEIARDMLLAPAFPEEELHLYQRKKAQRYRLAQMQNEYLANRIFSAKVFGETHPYGYTSTPDDFNALTTKDLKAHHRHLNRKTLNVFVAGNLDDHILEMTREMISGLPTGNPDHPMAQRPVQEPGNWELPGPQPHQIAVRIGKQIISRGHEDYPGLFLLNTILGGYHGSRLVRNLREAKGLTYNVQSNLENLLQATCFVVSTDANNASRKVVLREINREIRKLHNTEIEAPELDMVRNYICGNFLMQIDGPLNVVDTIKPLVLHALPLSYFEEFIASIRQISAKELQTLAHKYFQTTEMTEVVVG